MLPRIALLLLVLAAAMSASPWAGSRACAACHAREVQTHAAGRHVRALRPVAGSVAVSLLDRPVRERSGLEFTYQVEQQGLRVHAVRGPSAASGMLEWLFGAGAMAFTPVGREGSRYFEHRVTWYTGPGRPGLTLGHQADPGAQLLGQPQRADTITRCFDCHATGVKPGPDLTEMTPGVQCERCHGPAAAHVAQPARGNIKVLSGLQQKASVAVCGECHRMPPTGQHPTPPEQSDPMSIRFAPLGLMASRCFQASVTLTCVTCHDPHAGRAPSAAEYVARCQGCHSPGAAVVSSACPRATDTRCLTCHMRKAAPVPDLPFTDHRIRVYPPATN